MTVILIGMIIYVIASAWDVGHVNRVIERRVNDRPLRQTPELPPAPRLVITYQSTDRRSN
jgi:hypothetical protein